MFLVLFRFLVYFSVGVTSLLFVPSFARFWVNLVYLNIRSACLKRPYFLFYFKKKQANGRKTYVLWLISKYIPRLFIERSLHARPDISGIVAQACVYRVCKNMSPRSAASPEHIFLLLYSRWSDLMQDNFSSEEKEEIAEDDFRAIRWTIYSSYRNIWIVSSLRADLCGRMLWWSLRIVESSISLGRFCMARPNEH